MQKYITFWRMKIIKNLTPESYSLYSIYLWLNQPERTRSYHDTRASRLIFCMHFCNFLIIYKIEKNSSSSKYLKKEKNSQTVFKQTIFSSNVHFESRIFWFKNRIFDFQQCFFKPKHKIYICDAIREKGPTIHLT